MHTRFFISLFPAIKQFLSLFRIQPFIVARKIIKKKKKGEEEKSNFILISWKK